MRAVDVAAAVVADWRARRSACDLPGEVLEEWIFESCALGTSILGRWLAEGEGVTAEEAEKLARTGQHAVVSAFALSDQVRNYLLWRDGTLGALAEEGARLGVGADLLGEVAAMVRRSCDASLVRMSRSFDTGWRSLQQRLDSEREKLAALAEQREKEAFESQRRAGLLATVASVARDVASMQPEELLGKTTSAMIDMGFDASSISIIDEESGTYAATHAMGMPEAYVDATHSASTGVTGMVRAAGRTVSAADYPSHRAAVPELAAAGFISAVGTPLWVNGSLAGVLTGGSKRVWCLDLHDIEAIELLAAVAGRALESARR